MSKSITKRKLALELKMHTAFKKRDSKTLQKLYAKHDALSAKQSAARKK